MKELNFNNTFLEKSALLPAKFISVTLALISSVALLFVFSENTETNIAIIVARGIMFLVSIGVFTLLQSSAGKENVFSLVHALLLIMAVTSAFIVFREPDKFAGNLLLITFIILIVGLSIGWVFKSQLTAIIYSSISFSIAIGFSSSPISSLEANSQIIIIFIVVSIASLAGSFFLNLEREQIETELNNFTPSDSKEDRNEELLEANIYEEIIDALPEGIFRTSIDGKILLANEALAKILGFEDVMDFSKVNANDLYVDDDERKKLLKVLLAQGKIKNYRIRLAKKDGSIIVARVSERVITDEENNPILIEGLIQDISQQVKIEEERKQEILELKSHKKKSIKEVNTAVYTSNIKAQFLASMSHEIKTPINSIVGFLTLIEKGMFDSEAELKDFAGNAKTAADALLDIINNMLDISKIEAGKMELDDSKFNIFDEVDKAKSIITSIAQNKNIKVKFETDKIIPKELYGDSTRYRQIAVNILNNAVKYTDEGSISFSLKLVKATEATVILKTTITDTGRGIPKEKQALIFKPYTQVKQKKWTTKDGAGLGLMISNEFVRLMGGEITIDSEEGVGTTVEFTTVMRTRQDFLKKEKEEEEEIPKKEVVEKAVQPTAKKVEEEVLEKIVKPEKDNKPIPSTTPLGDEAVIAETEAIEVDIDEEHHETVVKGNKKRLLLVEDNPISQKVEKKLLSDSGYEVEAVSSALDAIEAVKTNSFDLVLMDVEMPDMDGLTATQKIRQLDPPAKNIPIIAVTAHSSMKDREKCLASGMNDYIAKPININFMKMTIDQWLARDD